MTTFIPLNNNFYRLGDTAINLKVSQRKNTLPKSTFTPVAWQGTFSPRSRNAFVNALKYSSSIDI